MNNKNELFHRQQEVLYYKNQIYNEFNRIMNWLTSIENILPDNKIMVNKYKELYIDLTQKTNEFHKNYEWVIRNEDELKR